MANWIVNKNSDGTGTVHRDGVLITQVMGSGDADERRTIWQSVYNTVSAAFFGDAPPRSAFMADGPAIWTGRWPAGGKAQPQGDALSVVRGDNWEVGCGMGITGPTAIVRKRYDNDRTSDYDDLPISVPGSVVAWIPERPERDEIARRIVAAMRYCRGITTAELERRAPPPAPVPLLLPTPTPCRHLVIRAGSRECLDCGENAPYAAPPPVTASAATAAEHNARLSERPLRRYAATVPISVPAQNYYGYDHGARAYSGGEGVVPPVPVPPVPVLAAPPQLPPRSWPELPEGTRLLELD